MQSIYADRIVLKDISSDDAEPFYKIRSDKELLKYQNFSVSTLDESKAFIKTQLSINIGDKDQWKQIGIYTPLGQLIGDCAIQFLPEENRHAEIGCTIAPSYHNNGYATEAIKALTRHVFEHYPIHKFVAMVDVRNIPSQRMLEKSGFQKEGHFKLHYWDENDQAWIDELQYGLLNNQSS